MGIAATNIDGCTMNSFLDVPLEMNEGNGTSTKVKPWDADRLQAFKQKYIVDNISAIIIDEFSISFVATYPKDDSLSLVYKKNGFWDYDHPIAYKVKGQEASQKFTIDIPNGDYLENFQVTISTNKEQKEVKIDDVSIIYNDKLFFDGSNLKHISYFNSNSGLKWNDVKKTLELNFDGEFPPGFAGNEQLEALLTK